jgi:hypothetical protein
VLIVEINPHYLLLLPQWFELVLPIQMRRVKEIKARNEKERASKPSSLFPDIVSVKTKSSSANRKAPAGNRNSLMTSGMARGAVDDESPETLREVYYVSMLYYYYCYYYYYY